MSKKPRLFFKGRWRYDPANYGVGEYGFSAFNLAAAAWCASRNDGVRVRVVGEALNEARKQWQR